MKPGWNKAFSRKRLLNLLVIASFCVTIFTGWRAEDWIWLAAQVGVIALLVLDILWPESTTRPNIVKFVVWAVAVIAISSMSVVLWRQAVLHRTTTLEQVVPANLQIIPAQGTQGQTIEVTITGTSTNFTDGSVPHFGSGIKVLDSRFAGENGLTAHIEIDPATAIGFRRIWVSTPGERTTMDDSSRGGFVVLKSTATQR